MPLTKNDFFDVALQSRATGIYEADCQPYMFKRAIKWAGCKLKLEVWRPIVSTSGDVEVCQEGNVGWMFRGDTAAA